MKIAVIGTGYVGLVTGTCFADSGNDVTCVDIDQTEDRPAQAGRDADLRARPGRDGRAQRRAPGGCTSPPIWPAAIKPAEVVYLAVGTPQGDDGAADLSALWAVVDGIAPHLPPGRDRRHQEHRAGRHQRQDLRPARAS